MRGLTFGLEARLVQQILLGGEAVPAVDEPNGGADGGEIDGVLHGGIAPADHSHVFPLEKAAVTSGAVAHTPAAQALLPGHLQFPPADAVGQNEGAALKDLLSRPDRLSVPRSSKPVTAANWISAPSSVHCW